MAPSIGRLIQQLRHILIALVLLYGGFRLFQQSVAESASLAFSSEGDDGTSLSGSNIESYAHAYLRDIQRAYDPQRALEDYGYKLGDTSLDVYSNELESTFDEYIASSSSSSSSSSSDALVQLKEAMMTRLSLYPPLRPYPDMPKIIRTTDKSNGSVPEQFWNWKELGDEWNITVHDDEGMQDWVKTNLEGSPAAKVFELLPRRVLQSDMFRYMTLFLEGGIYTDSDTAPVANVSDWGRGYTTRTPELLSHLSRILSLTQTSSIPTSDLSSHHQQTFDASQSGKEVYHSPLIQDGGEEGEPSLVISVEFDAVKSKSKDWRDTGVRALQIAQWTMLARPGHPIFLDALGRIFENTRRIIMLRNKSGSEPIDNDIDSESALEWTGPGVFTDSVFRYLLARYGFLPEQLVRVTSPVRVGDVLILPAGSFANWSSDSVKSTHGVVWHGFYGRWRPYDPTEEKFEGAEPTPSAGENHP